MHLAYRRTARPCCPAPGLYGVLARRNAILWS